MKKLFIISYLLVVGIMELSAQIHAFCHTPAKSSNIDLNLSTLKSTTIEQNYILRIYVHVIRRSNGTGGQSVDDVETALSFLDSDFNPHGIYFSWDENIDYIDNDNYFDTPNTSIFSVNNHTDGIDIYLFDDDSEPFGLANGVGMSSEMLVAGSIWDVPRYGSLVRSHVISHEMGHVLFLWHTHHGTWFEAGVDTNQCAELVDGSNSSTCGDYITDTPADPWLFDFNYTTCTWTEILTDANGDIYNPDETLIMSYAPPDCMRRFSEEQANRMRNAIATLPFLQDVIIPCGETVISNITITSDESYLNCVVTVLDASIENNANVRINAINELT
ncbi:MAG: hypothetical protein ACOC3T_06310, partial [Bacteroidota bacterium]